MPDWIVQGPPKHPSSTKWYYLQWSSDELNGASITASVWSGLGSLTSVTESISGATVGIKISGGAQDEVQTLLNQITTSDGEILHQSLKIHIDSRGH